MAVVASPLDEIELEHWCGALEAIVVQPGQTTADASEIEPWLFLGGKPAAEEAFHGNKQRITHILNCCEPWCADGPNHVKLKYAGFEALDEPGYPLLTNHYLVTARPFLDEVRLSNGRCLVHCAMGVNRSAAIVVAYLVDRLCMNLISAVEHVRQARGCILGNSTFRAELVKFAYQADLEDNGGRLGNLTERDRWFELKPPPPTPDPFVFGPPPEAWVSLPLKVGARARIRECGDEWCEGIVIQLDQIDADAEAVCGHQLCVVQLDKGGEDSIELYDGYSPDICAVPVDGKASDMNPVEAGK